MSDFAREIKAGSTDVTIYMRMLDSTTALPKTDGAYNSAGLTLSYVRDKAAAVSITPATQTAAGAHSDGGFVHVANGLYRVDLPDAACATGVDAVMVTGAITGGVLIPVAISLVRVSFAATITSIPELGVLRLGSLVSADATGAVLDSGAAFADDGAIGSMLLIAGGSGYGQSRMIIDNALSGDAFTVDAWNVEPADGDSYVLFAGAPGSAASPTPVHVASAATNSITAGAVASDAATEIAAAVWAATTRILTAGTNLNILAAADIRAALGMAAADFDSQLDAVMAALTTIAGDTTTDIPALIAALDVLIDGIKAKTDQLTFTVANLLDINMKRVLDLELAGDGSTTPIGVA